MDVLSMLSVSTGTVQVLFVMNYHSSVVPFGCLFGVQTRGFDVSAPTAAKMLNRRAENLHAGH